MINLKKIVINIILIILIVNVFYLIDFEAKAATLGEMQKDIDNFMSEGKKQVDQKQKRW